MTTITQYLWKNKKGTADRESPYGSWKAYWMIKSKRLWPSECSVVGCHKTASLGAHVICRDVSGEYIVPMCDSCNHRDDPFCLKADTVFVPANISR